MSEALRQIVPSMFHRRLLLLGVVGVLFMLLLALQTARLTTGSQHELRRAMVEKALEVPDLTPTVRGRILDRKGRVLAEDAPGTDIEVSFGVMTGDWAFGRAVDAAKHDLGRAKWSALDRVQREEMAYEYAKPFEEEVERLWTTLAELAQIEPMEVTQRRDRTVRWVQQLSALATDKKRRRRMSALRDESENVSWNDVYVEVAEELQPHGILFDVGDETRSRIEYFIAKAEQEQDEFLELRKQDPNAMDERDYGVWLEVKPTHVKQRRYPWESRTFFLDRSTLPGPLKSDKPLEIAVDGIGRHIVGQLRRVNEMDGPWKARPYRKKTEDGGEEIDLAGYRPNDPIGRFGIERSMESVLRGTRGQRIFHLDTQEEERLRPLPGGDVYLTIDAELQARVQALMSHDPRVGLMIAQPWHGGEQPQGTPLNGAAVVMSIDNGEVLAAVSVPGISIKELTENDKGIYSDHVNLPYLFRPVQYRYEPGSTNKPLVLAAAITDGLIGPNETLDCTLGRLWEEKENVFRDWRVKQGGPPFGIIDGVEAIKVSSNVFFGKLALMYGQQEKFGYRRMPWWFSQFGFGRRSGVGLYEEVAGFLPDPSKRLSEPEAAYMAIGEGAMGITPLQVVNAHATLARGGLFIPPTFVMDESRPDAPRQATPLHLSPAAKERALRGMLESANALGGTTRGMRFTSGFEPNFTCPGITFYAKSGTAQPPPLRQPLPDGRPDPHGEVVRSGNHAWVVALLQPEGEPRPTVAISLVVEFAGSGGRVAGPIVNQIAYTLQELGYLGVVPAKDGSAEPDS